MRNLRQIVGTARPGDSPEVVQDALRQWLAATSSEDLTEQTWQRAWYLSFTNPPDLTPILRSEAATSVPAKVFAALHLLETEITNLDQLEGYLNELYRQDIAPLWYGRRVPLPAADRRKLEIFIRLVEVWLGATNRCAMH